MSDFTLPEGLGKLLGAFAVVSVLALVTAAVLGVVLWRRWRRLRITPGAGFWQTLREVPLGLVVVLDLLDLSLDVLSTPIVWWLLGRLNLRALREVASVEALIPFTGPIPTMTLSWWLARAMPSLGPEPARDRERHGGPVLQAERVAPGRWQAGQGAPRQAGELPRRRP
jgi:hypothetical protein